MVYLLIVCNLFFFQEYVESLDIETLKRLVIRCYQSGNGSMEHIKAVVAQLHDQADLINQQPKMSEMNLTVMMLKTIQNLSTSVAGQETVLQGDKSLRNFV